MVERRRKIDEEKNDGRLKGKRGRNPRPRPSLLSFSHAYDLTPPPSEFRALLSECTEQANMTELSRWYVIHPAAQSIAILKGGKDSFSLHIAVTKIQCEDLPRVVLKQCDELELITRVSKR